jgi:hypothetical protein
MLSERERVLRVIETIAANTDLDIHPGFDQDKATDTEVPERPLSEMSRERLEAKFQKARKAISAIYRYSHVATAHSCRYVHDDWFEDFVATEKAMVEGNQLPDPNKEEEK